MKEYALGNVVLAEQEDGSWVAMDNEGKALGSDAQEALNNLLLSVQTGPEEEDAQKEKPQKKQERKKQNRRKSREKSRPKGPFQAKHPWWK